MIRCSDAGDDAIIVIYLSSSEGPPALPDALCAGEQEACVKKLWRQSREDGWKAVKSRQKRRETTAREKEEERVSEGLREPSRRITCRDPTAAGEVVSRLSQRWPRDEACSDLSSDLYDDAPSLNRRTSDSPVADRTTHRNCRLSFPFPVIASPSLCS